MVCVSYFFFYNVRGRGRANSVNKDCFTQPSLRYDGNLEANRVSLSDFLQGAAGRGVHGV